MDTNYDQFLLHLQREGYEQIQITLVNFGMRGRRHVRNDQFRRMKSVLWRYCINDGNIRNHQNLQDRSTRLGTCKCCWLSPRTIDLSTGIGTDCHRLCNAVAEVYDAFQSNRRQLDNKASQLIQIYREIQAKYGRSIRGEDRNIQGFDLRYDEYDYRVNEYDRNDRFIASSSEEGSSSSDSENDDEDDNDNVMPSPTRIQGRRRLLSRRREDTDSADRDDLQNRTIDLTQDTDDENNSD